MIEIVPYNPDWPEEFLRIAARLRQELRHLALRIDHIGSTSVPGLDAKDIIDIQVTVAGLEPPDPIIAAMDRAGYTQSAWIVRDHAPPGFSGPDSEWSKMIFGPKPGGRRTNIHVRVQGRANQRYALLFRDYLRTHPRASGGYLLVKQALARRHPDDIGAYLEVKDPVCDIIIAGAEEWARSTGWQQGWPDA